MEYKYVLLDHSGQHAVAWQRGNNSVLAVRQSDDFLEVFDNWWVPGVVTDVLSCLVKGVGLAGRRDFLEGCGNWWVLADAEAPEIAAGVWFSCGRDFDSVFWYCFGWH